MNGWTHKLGELVGRLGAASRKLAIRVPVVRDFMDLRGTTAPSEKWLPDLLAVAVPGVLGIVPLWTPLATVLDGMPWAARVMRATLPILVLGNCVSIVMATKRDDATGFGRTAKVLYRFSAGVRRLAKVLAPAALAVAAGQLLLVLPNSWLGREKVRGYVCLGGSPGDAVVDVMDALSQSIALLPSTIDDTGYFVIDLRPSGAAPVKLQLRGGKCDKVEFGIDGGQVSAAGCDSTLFPPPLRKPARLWVVSCAQ